ncbi:MAG: hypothetical protein KDH94_03190, partial [Coxiellaceae bacterium]|nr:hypothetical protein [Coxiellaceae bacterium]
MRDYLIKSFRFDFGFSFRTHGLPDLIRIEGEIPPNYRTRVAVEKKPWVLTAEGYYHRDNKPAQLDRTALKDRYSKSQSTTLVSPDEGILPRAFGMHDPNRNQILAGIGMEFIPENAVATRFYSGDVGSFKRPWRKESEWEAKYYFTNSVDGVFKEASPEGGPFMFSDRERFKTFLKNNDQVFNEVLAKLQFRADPSCFVCVFSDTLDGRLLAQDYARLLKERLRQKVISQGGEFNENYVVPIKFYSRNKVFMEYTEQEQKKDREEAQQIYKKFRVEVGVNLFYRLHTGSKSSAILLGLEEKGVLGASALNELLNRKELALVESLLEKGIIRDDAAISFLTIGEIWSPLDTIVNAARLGLPKLVERLIDALSYNYIAIAVLRSRLRDRMSNYYSLNQHIRNLNDEEFFRDVLPHILLTELVNYNFESEVAVQTIVKSLASPDILLNLLKHIVRRDDEDRSRSIAIFLKALGRFNKVDVYSKISQWILTSDYSNLNGPSYQFLLQQWRGFLEHAEPEIVCAIWDQARVGEDHRRLLAYLISNFPEKIQTKLSDFFNDKSAIINFASDYIWYNDSIKALHYFLKEYPSQSDFIDRHTQILIYASLGNLEALKTFTPQELITFRSPVMADTVLHIVARCGYVDCVRYLMESTETFRLSYVLNEARRRPHCDVEEKKEVIDQLVNLQHSDKLTPRYQMTSIEKLIFDINYKDGLIFSERISRKTVGSDLRTFFVAGLKMITSDSLQKVIVARLKSFLINAKTVSIYSGVFKSNFLHNAYADPWKLILEFVADPRNNGSKTYRYIFSQVLSLKLDVLTDEQKALLINSSDS